MNEIVAEDLLRETRVIPNFLSDPNSLMRQAIESFDWDCSILDRPFARFGFPYSDDEDRREVPFPEVLESLRHRIREELGFFPNSCSCHWYLQGGSYMGFHSDNVDDIEERTGVAILSLGEERVLRFKSKADSNVKHDFPLASGSLFFMSRKLQEVWKHGVPKQTAVGERMSLVFRCIPTSASRL